MSYGEFILLAINICFLVGILLYRNFVCWQRERIRNKSFEEGVVCGAIVQRKNPQLNNGAAVLEAALDEKWAIDQRQKS